MSLGGVLGPGGVRGTILENLKRRQQITAVDGKRQKLITYFQNMPNGMILVFQFQVKVIII